MIEIREIPNNLDAIAEWDPDACGGEDYDTPRARALYDALGVSQDDDEYQLAASRDGRWALIGLAVQGYRYACEVEKLRETASAKKGA